MIQTVSIKEDRTFRRAYRKGNYSAGRILSVFVIEDKNKEINRLGIVVSKKVGNSVQRNRVRRLIRECYRLSELKLKKGYDIVFSARETKRVAPTAKNRVKAVVLPDFEKVRREMDYHFAKLGLFIEQKPEGEE